MINRFYIAEHMGGCCRSCYQPATEPSWAPRWCVSCFEAAQTVVVCFKNRLRCAIEHHDQRTADVVQHTLESIPRELHPREASR